MILELTVLVDNYCASADLISEYGFSVYLKGKDGRVLMDTGLGRALMPNMASLGIDLNAINDLVLSHGHFDHTGSLAQVLSKNSSMRIWAHPEVDALHLNLRDGIPDFVGCHLNKKAVDFRPVSSLTRIIKGVWAVEVPPEKRDPEFWDRPENLVVPDGKGGFLPDPFSDDISLVVEGDKGLSVILGCAHAGVVNILETVAEHFKTRDFYLVVGGMHTRAFNRRDLDKVISALLGRFSVKKWGPSHCSGFNAAAEMAVRAENVSWYGSGSRIRL